MINPDKAALDRLLTDVWSHLEVTARYYPPHPDQTAQDHITAARALARRAKDEFRALLDA